jgi:hypothetical protein
MKIEAPIEVTVSLGPDGEIVVNVDTTEDTERVRVLLNDATLYVGHPGEQEAPAALLMEISRVLDTAAADDGYLGIPPEARIRRILHKRITIEEYR